MIARTHLVTSILLSALVCSSCAVVEEQQSPGARLEPVWETLPAAPPAPDTAVSRPAPAVQEAAELYDVDVQNSPARAFFMSLVKGTDYNMVVHPDVDGTITLSLRDVSIDEVMDMAQRVFGYEYERTRSGFIVMPSRLEARVFRVDYPNCAARASPRPASAPATRCAPSTTAPMRNPARGRAAS